MIYDVGLQRWRGKWEGRAAFIIGCGPSLLNWPVNYLEKQNTIAVNSSAYYFKSSYRIFFDRAILSKDFPSVHHFTTRCWLQNRKKLNPDEYNRMDKVTWTFFDVTPQLCMVLPNKITELWGPTTFAAISLALVMGVTVINLVGIDFGSMDRMTHWNGNFNKSVVNELGANQLSIFSHKILPYFKEHNLEINWLQSPGIAHKWAI